MQELYIDGNQISVLPDEIGYLREITELGLLNNQLVEIPRTIGHLTKLKCLHAEGNKIELYLRDNCFATLPDALCDLAELDSLYLEDNQMTTAGFPTRFGEMISLKGLCLHRNKLVDFPMQKQNYFIINKPWKLLSKSLIWT